MSSRRVFTLFLASLGAWVIASSAVGQAPKLGVEERRQLIEEHNRLDREWEQLFDRARYRVLASMLHHGGNNLSHVKRVGRTSSSVDSSGIATHCVHNPVGAAWAQIGEGEAKL